MTSSVRSSFAPRIVGLCLLVGLVSLGLLLSSPGSSPEASAGDGSAVEVEASTRTVELAAVDPVERGGEREPVVEEREAVEVEPAPGVVVRSAQADGPVLFAPGTALTVEVLDRRSFEPALGAVVTAVHADGSRTELGPVDAAGQLVTDRLVPSDHLIATDIAGRTGSCSVLHGVDEEGLILMTIATSIDISGVCVDAATGNPVDGRMGVELRLRRKLQRDLAFVQAVPVGVDGSFRFTGVEPDELYSIHATIDSYAMLWSGDWDDVEPSAVDVANVEVRVGRVMHGRVRIVDAEDPVEALQAMPSLQRNQISIGGRAYQWRWRTIDPARTPYACAPAVESWYADVERSGELPLLGRFGDERHGTVEVSISLPGYRAVQVDVPLAPFGSTAPVEIVALERIGEGFGSLRVTGSAITEAGRTTLHGGYLWLVSLGEQVEPMRFRLGVTFLDEPVVERIPAGDYAWSFARIVPPWEQQDEPLGRVTVLPGEEAVVRAEPFDSGGLALEVLGPDRERYEGSLTARLTPVGSSAESLTEFRNSLRLHWGSAPFVDGGIPAGRYVLTVHGEGIELPIEPTVVEIDAGGRTEAEIRTPAIRR